MKRRTWYSFVKSHNLVSRIYDMLDYYNCFRKRKIYDKGLILSEIKNSLNDACYVETLAKYFEERKERCKKNIDLRCNLIDLINDLDYLKQYLNKNN